MPAICLENQFFADTYVLFAKPRASGITKPRFAMTAQSSESIQYDYYNPEARASVPPARFNVEGSALPNEVKNTSVHSEKAQRRLEVAFTKM